MSQTSLVFGAPDWWPVAAAAAIVLLGALAWSYARPGPRGGRGLRVLAFALKAVGVLILVACLLEPLFSGTRARPGANAFVVLADNSQSMTLRDAAGRQSRADEVRGLADANSPWQAKLRKDFDVRAFAFDARLRSLADGETLALDGRASDLGASLDRIARRYQGRPLAGVMLLTDGTATDADAVERLLARHATATVPGGAGRLPPIYPVVVGGKSPAADVGVADVAVTQTNFEDAPVSVTAQVSATGYGGRSVAAQLLDDAGKVVDAQSFTPAPDGRPTPVRFKVRPTKPGVTFYRVRAAAADELEALDAPDMAKEATLANNARTVAVDRGAGPYRVLYVSGRPNWEFKFLHRGVQQDDQVQLVGLVRVAKREPKFSFLGRAGDPSNPLFRGFDDPNKQGTGEYDKPVMVRVNTRDQDELRGGFPKTAEELNAYHAVVIDDLESEFFSPDQLQLLKEFVRRRGGGLLMLGGQESFKNGKYDRTPLGDVMPVYADEAAPVPAGAKYRLALTREGWLEPWVRLRPAEGAEEQRLAAMPGFMTLNQVRGIKPGATVLARVTGPDGASVPALVEQRFGQGRVAALLVGDLWRWGLARPADTESDLEKAWRQTVRWLVADVPRRIEVTTSTAAAEKRTGESRAGEDDAEAGTRLSVQVRDAAYDPVDHATVSIKVTAPDGTSLDLPADPTGQPGRYEATYVPRQGGAYRATATATVQPAESTDKDGEPAKPEVTTADAGWASDPSADEFRELRPNRDLMARLAAATGGQVIEAADVESFAAGLPTRQAELTDPYVVPVWHTPWVFAAAIVCLAAEWGLRRWKGLP